MKNFIPIILLITLVSCSSVTWVTSVGPSIESVDMMLEEEFYSGETWSYELKRPDNFQLPSTLRPCCAFGTDHKIQFGLLPIPLVKMSNTVSLKDIGAHSYDSSAFTVSSYQSSNGKQTENNGLIYTEKGGLLDTAHIRDTADLTLALFYEFYENLGKDKVIHLRRELGPSQIHLKAFDVSKFSNRERWFLSSALAARKAYQMAVAHEIAQWHGYRSIEFFNETVSAYSPEDLYSNLLGAKISSTLINKKLSLSSFSYNKYMTIWLEKTIEVLDPVSKEDTNLLLLSVDGVMWDSSRRLPSKELLIKRNYNISDTQNPLIFPAQITTKKPQTIKLAKFLYGLDLDKIALYSFEVDARFQKNFSHIPKRIWKNGIKSTDFSKIAKLDQIEDKKFFHALNLKEQEY